MSYFSLRSFSKAMMVGFVVLATAGYSVAATGDQSKQTDQEASSSQQQQQQQQKQQQKKHAEKMAARLHHALFKKIDLSDKQDKSVKKVMADAREERLAWMKKHQDDFQDIRQEMRNARRDQDRSKAKDARKKLVKLMKSAPKPSATMDKVRKVLKSDQKKQFNQNIKDLRKQFQRKRGSKAQRQSKNNKSHSDDQNDSK